MNSLFSYRITIALGLITVLILNAIFDFWGETSAESWWLVSLYLGMVCLTQLFSVKTHDKWYPVTIDLFVWGLFFSFNQGVSNPLIWCLFLPPLFAAIKFNKWFAWLATTTANLIYLLLWYLQAPPAHHHMMQSHVIGMWLGFIAISLMLTWIITTLMEQLKSKNKALIDLQQKQAEDFNMVKMATLATSLAHELGSPLHSIKLLVNELSYDLKDSEHAKDCRILDEQVTRCKKALGELTKITTQSDTNTHQQVNLKNYLNDILNTFEATHPSIKIQNLLSKDMQILSDDLLPLVFLNVINNSIAAGSTNIFLTAQSKNNEINILIKDDGAGLNHSEKNGLGIGLKLAARIMEAMKGQLIFQCTPDGAETQILIQQAP
ncbi:sensor histidine kinase [Marinicella rhabdoformis]|uniref:sensor histidine kinase n=1 Tax=Marinicella rhabdoformis TaxID=2580566 RepID=UPI0012AECED2|nr:HAMP domain-containing sensor histidine kinase [Marinicella rhabdoformis]